MLRSLAIRDYAIIERIELTLGPGMTVLTGETGAGKSILVDALGLVLGDRADSTTVRHGTERTEVTAAFDVTALPRTREWLDDNDLSEGDDCILRRVVGADGRSRGYINGRATPLTLMRELGEQLVDIHGQHEHQSLLRRAEQLQLLDDHGQLDDAAAGVAALFRDWQAAENAFTSLETAAADRAARLDLLRYQVRELEALALADGEIEALEAEHAKLANAGRLLEAVQAALSATDAEDGHGARGSLHAAVSALDDAVALDPGLADIRDLLQQASIQAGEAATDLNRWLDRFEADPERTATVESRLDVAYQLARKHRVEPAGLPGLLERLREERDGLDHADEELARLAQKRDTLTATYREAAAALSAARAEAATALSGRVTEAMQTLGMPGGRFEAAIESDPGRFGPNGVDSAVLSVTANPGQPLRPLARAASGGELSRISLAIQVSAARTRRIPCLIFDEVDAGIGGGVAEIVGQRLRRVAEDGQVLCVTHLPQVASQAQAHLRVLKEGDDVSTTARVEALDGARRVDELARMLGGVKVTDKARAAAKELLAGN